MTFASTKQLLIMTFLWALGLLGIDYVKNPRSVEQLFSSSRGQMGESKKDDKPVIKLWMNHLCCTACLTDVTTALAPFTAMKVKRVPLDSQDHADEKPVKGMDFANQVEIEVSDLRKIDFVAIDRALRKAGLVAERIEFSGPRHFRLEAQLNHMCCQMCATGISTGLDMIKGLKAQQRLKWLDSFNVVKQRKLVVAHARYDAVVDVAELIAAFNQVGFHPTSIFALSDAEKPATGK